MTAGGAVLAPVVQALEAPAPRGPSHWLLEEVRHAGLPVPSMELSASTPAVEAWTNPTTTRASAGVPNQRLYAAEAAAHRAETRGDGGEGRAEVGRVGYSAGGHPGAKAGSTLVVLTP